MPRTFDQIIAELAVLNSEDFNLMRQDSDGPERLNALTNELLLLPHPERGVRMLFNVMERLAESDLGSPGPLVHTLEKMRGHYECELVDSIRRKPTSLTVWMVNRLLNATPTSEQRQFYLDLLRFVSKHPDATPAIRREALHYIEHKNGES